MRLLRPGGQCLIYVWALEQELHKVKSNYLKASKAKGRTVAELEQEAAGPSESTGEKAALPVHVNRTKFERQDVLVPWHLKKSANSVAESNGEDAPVLHRFYHVFHEGELEDLCMKLGNVTIVKSYYDKGNWCIILSRCE